MEPLDIQSATLDEHGDVHVTISGYRFVAQRNIKVLEELLDKGWAAYFPKDNVPPEWVNFYSDKMPPKVGSSKLNNKGLLLTSHPVLVAIALVDFLDLLGNGDGSQKTVPIPTFDEAVRDIRARRITNLDNLVYRSKVPGILRWNRDGTRIMPGNEQPICFEIEFSSSEEDPLDRRDASQDECDPFTLAKLLLPADQSDEDDLSPEFTINDYHLTGLESPTPQMYLISFKGLIVVEKLDLDEMLITIPVGDREVTLGDFLLVDSGFPDGGMNLWIVIELPVYCDVDDDEFYYVHARLVASKPSFVCKLKGDYSTEDVYSDGSLKLIINQAHSRKIIGYFIKHDRNNLGFLLDSVNRKEGNDAFIRNMDIKKCLIGLKLFLENCVGENATFDPGCLFVNQGMFFVEVIPGRHLELYFEKSSKPGVKPGSFIICSGQSCSDLFHLYYAYMYMPGETAYDYTVHCKLLTSAQNPLVGAILSGNLTPCKPDARLAYVDDKNVKEKVFRCLIENESAALKDSPFSAAESEVLQDTTRHAPDLKSITPRIFLISCDFEARESLFFTPMPVTISYSQTKVQVGDWVMIEHAPDESICGLWEIDSVELLSAEDQTCCFSYDFKGLGIEIPRSLIDGRFQYLDSTRSCAIISDSAAAKEIIDFFIRPEIVDDITEFPKDTDEAMSPDDGN